uniref:polynucleotide adenylyltransferase n=1 Tax=Meloidogyne floridensis TaxID=298350 RepID=A0A915P3T2_9BILA
MLSKWYEKSKLLISGSYLLKANTPDSDFDCLVVVPNNGYINYYFYGNSECNLKEKNCFDRSLFCIFCLHSRTNFIAKIEGRIPLIKINFMEAEFDLLLVSLPKNSFNKLIAFNEPKIEKVDEAIATYILERIGGIEAKNNGQLWPLSGYRANLRLYELTVNSRKTFTMLLQTIKFWTKNHYIYGSKFGFLNGSAIAILTCKIILDFPANSVPFLLKKFFDIYSKWEWPKPVEIVELANKKYNEIRLVLDWFGTKEVYHRHLNQFHVDLYPWLLEHSKLQWVVLNPGFPTQNTTFNVNKSTAEILKLEFLEGKLII